MPTRTFIVDTGFTGTTVTPEITLPGNHDSIYVTGIISAPISPLNVYDIIVTFEVFEDGAWRVRDRSAFLRDLVTGPLEAVHCSFVARVDRINGKPLRASLSCGQSVLAVSLTASW